LPHAEQPDSCNAKAAGNEERITLSHTAENRMIFARGAVRGAEWLIGKAPGRYTMAQVLGL
jgi:4-hydroxy-tetrahydrodipicolinate reductase